MISAASWSRVHFSSGRGVFCGTMLRRSATAGASCWSQEQKFPAVPGNPKVSAHSSYFKCMLTGPSCSPLLCCGGVRALRWIRDKCPLPLQVALVQQRPCLVPGTRASQDPVSLHAWECQATCHAWKTSPTVSPHAATVMREGTAPKRSPLGFFKAVWGRAEPQVCSRAVVCSCP